MTDTDAPIIADDLIREARMYLDGRGYQTNILAHWHPILADFAKAHSDRLTRERDALTAQLAERDEKLRLAVEALPAYAGECDLCGHYVGEHEPGGMCDGCLPHEFKNRAWEALKQLRGTGNE